MKRLIVTDEDGTIVATGPHPHEFPGSTAEGGFGLAALDGQTVHEVELPDDLTTIEQIRRLHHSHRITMENGVAKLTERISPS
jgi:hypothetical protein